MDESHTSYPTEQYCIVIVSPKLFSSKFDLSIDFGEETNAINNQAENETIKKIGSLVDALNYMSRKGWQLINSYAASNTNKGISEHHYVMRKRAR